MYYQPYPAMPWNGHQWVTNFLKVSDEAWLSVQLNFCGRNDGPQKWPSHFDKDVLKVLHQFCLQLSWTLSFCLFFFFFFSELDLFVHYQRRVNQRLKLNCHPLRFLEYNRQDSKYHLYDVMLSVANPLVIAATSILESHEFSILSELFICILELQIILSRQNS